MQEMLKALCAAPGVAGDEAAAAQAAEQLLAPLGKMHRTALGGVVCTLPPRGDKAPTVLLTAHLDQIGMMVTQITEKGFLKVTACGGVDRRSLAGARVTVHTSQGPLPGVVKATPPHLASGKATTETVQALAVDVGMTAGEARQHIAPGDRISFDGEFCALLGDRICAPSLDDRAGCAAVIRAAMLLRDCTAVNLAVALAPLEEINSAGAATAAFGIAPDFAFAVDVSFATTVGEQREECGELGKGPMIGIAPVLDRALFRGLVQAAKRAEIPYQLEVMGSRTGTDADAIAPSGMGVRTGLVSIPQRHMHTASEIVALCDVENTARLLAEAIGGGICNN